MFNWFRRKEKRIAFIDGDQPIQQYMDSYVKHVADSNTDTYLIRLKKTTDNEPKRLRKIDKRINKIYLSHLTGQKEVVDKFICGYIQKAIANGYKHITVISSDYDFIDIFKMSLIINDDVTDKVKFRLIVPKASGRMLELPDQILNIEIIK